MQIRFVVVPTVLLFTLFVLASCEEETPTRAARRVNKSTDDDGNDNLKRTRAETLAYWQEYGVKTGFEYFHKYIAYEGPTTSIPDAEKLAFDKHCATCHHPPRVMDAPFDATLAIYTYKSMLPKLKSGHLIEQMRGLNNHPGGNLCFAGMDETPCKEVYVWLAGEFPELTPKTGEIREALGDGRVYGWAGDERNQEKTFEVNLYVDGDNKTGTAVGSVLADDKGYAGGLDGNHAFMFDLKKTISDDDGFDIDFLDGQQRKLYAYAVVNGKEVQLAQTPFNFKAWGYTTDGQEYFNNNFQFIANCGCHGTGTANYTTWWSAVMSPFPDAGGARNRNDFYDYGAGNKSHPGGNYGPANNMAQWWDLEANP